MSMQRLPDGRYRLRYYYNGTKSGKFAQETLPATLTKQEATRIYRARLAAASMRHGHSARQVTFAQLAAEYLAEHGPLMAANSEDRAEATLRLHILPVFGHMLVESIKGHHVARWQRERAAVAKPATVNREWSIFKAILNFGEAKELIERNPIRRGAVKMLKADNMRTAFFEPDEWREFLSAFDDPDRWQQHLKRVRETAEGRFANSGEPRGVGARKPDGDAAAAYLARLRGTIPLFRALLYTGARLGELLSLTWSAVDLKREMITIYQHKTRAAKPLPIVAPLRTLLLALSPGVGNALVFRKPGGEGFYPMEVQRAFAVAQKLSGADPDLSIHSIRHTVGSWLTIAGHPERHIGEILGHARGTITRRYAHLTQGSLRPVLDDLVRIEADGFREVERSTHAEMG